MHAHTEQRHRCTTDIKLQLALIPTSLKHRFPFNESAAVNRLKNVRHFKCVVLTANLAVLLSQAV